MVTPFQGLPEDGHDRIVRPLLVHHACHSLPALSLYGEQACALVVFSLAVQEAQPVAVATTSATFVPPKPKELERVTWCEYSRVSVGTIAFGRSGSCM